MSPGERHNGVDEGFLRHGTGIQSWRSYSDWHGGVQCELRRYATGRKIIPTQARPNRTEKIYWKPMPIAHGMADSAWVSFQRNLLAIY